MKKVIMLLTACLIAAGTATSQIVKTESRMRVVEEEKKEVVHYPYNFFVKVGAGAMVISDVEDGSSKGTFNALLGYQKQVNSKGLYWGAEIGFSTIGFKYETYRSGDKYNPVSGYYDYYHYYNDEGKSAVSALGALMIGIKRPLGGDRYFDGHIGAGYQGGLGSFENHKSIGEYHDYSWSYTYEESQSGPIWEIGLGVWFNRFLVEIQYKGCYNINYPEVINTSICVNLGYKF